MNNEENQQAENRQAENQQPENQPLVAATALNIKIPPFWPADPAIWFAQVEATFSTKRVTAQKTKFDFVVASLTPEVVTEVRDLVLHPPNDNPYDVLKETLIKRTAASEQRHLQQLLSTEELGDRKPTQLLRRMQQLLGDNAALNDSFLKELFLQRLPSNVRMVLASSPPNTPLESLAELADRVIEVAIPAVAAVTPTAPSQQPQPSAKVIDAQTPTSQQFEQLIAGLAKLQATVTTLTRARSKTPKRHPRRPSPSPSAGASPDDHICWYHRKYGEEARKCTTPCNFHPN